MINVKKIVREFIEEKLLLPFKRNLKSGIRQKIITLLTLFILVNIGTNYRFYMRILYKGEEKCYLTSDVRSDEGRYEYELKDLNTDITALQLVFEEEKSTSVEVKFTSDDFSKYDHFNGAFYKEYSGCKDVLVLFSLNGKVENI